MHTINGYKTKGSFLGLTSGIFWGLNSVLIGLILIVPYVSKLGAVSSLIITLIHDFISFSILFILLIKMKQVKNMFKVLFSKSGLSIVSAALLGGPIGMGAYIVSIKYLGPTLASSGSAIYPAVGAILSYFVLKRRMKMHSIIGFIIAISSIALMGIGSLESVANLGLGILFLVICVIGWGSEAVIIDASLTEEVSSEIALAIRQLTTFTVYTIFLLPNIGINGVISILSVNNVLILVVLASLTGTLSYLAYYKSIDLIGATQAMGLNISYPAWAFIFQFMIEGTFSWYTFILAILIMVGSLMSNDDPSEFLRIFKFR